MEGRAKARHDEEMRKKADELGIDLGDPVGLYKLRIQLTHSLKPPGCNP
jgi:hypothetical protein